MSKAHTVKQGECLSKIAKRFGFTDWRYLYEHPENASLRARRPNPNVLFPGDIVNIPELRVREERIETTRVHRFVVQSPRKFLRVVFKDAQGGKLANELYSIRFSSGRSKAASTNADGLLNEPVSFDEDSATVEIGGRTLHLNLGHLNPTGDVVKEDISGIQARLNNLGYNAGPNDGIYGRKTRLALALLQADEDCDVSGLPDEETLSRLEELHGC